MPKPVGSDQRYMPGLDGLRAIAVLAVIAFHVQFGWAPGGLLGVGIFFTLSGYLITDLLLNRWTASGRLHLAEFWMRRARRLLPALFVMLAVVTAWVTIADRVRLASLRGAVGAASTYWSNWYVIIKGQSYFARFAPAQPLDHLWSLAVEEQFYLIWPWLLLAGVFLIRRRGASALPWLALPTLAMAAASAVAAVLLYRPGFDPTRIYEGTDTRASGLLIGAALAMLWSSRRAAVTGKTGQRLLDWPGFAGLAVIGIMIWRVGQYSPFLYRGGLVVLALATAAVVAAAACPATLTAKALGWRPLRWLGVRSYGIYLWHFPVIVLTTPANSTEDLPRAAAQVAVTIAIAAVSWRYIEEPIRRGAIGRAWQQLRSRRLPSMPPASIAAAGATVGVLVVASVGLAGAISAPAGASSGTALALGATSGGTASSVTQVHGSDPTGGQKSGTSAAATPPAFAATGQRIGSGGLLPVSLRDRPRPLMTSCQSVVHIGDSTSEGLVSPNYLPNWRQRIPAQYEDVGVHTVYTNITGARSVVEVLPGTTNAYDAAKGLVAQGFHGCWVLALGTNDTADVAVGSNVGLTTRINRMMSATHGGPVMWIEAVSLLSSGPYAEANMAKWNAALLKACARYPNMRVFDWPALAKRSWFISDGIHYTSAGYAVRGHDIAQGLATAFPAGGSSSGCVVS